MPPTSVEQLAEHSAQLGVRINGPLTTDASIDVETAFWLLGDLIEQHAPGNADAQQALANLRQHLNRLRLYRIVLSPLERHETLCDAYLAMSQAVQAVGNTVSRSA